MRLVIVESPYAGDVETNVMYARACMLNSLLKGEAPFLEHLLYTQVLDDTVPAERAMGIAAGLAWRKARTCLYRHDMGTILEPVLPAFYVDLGWSPAMLAARAWYERERIAFEERTIAPYPPPARLIEGGRGLERDGGTEP
jgi:hypothetical protein